MVRAYETAETSTGRSPVGLVIHGQHGAGKTHLIRWAREQVQQGHHGYFFLMGIADGKSFWPNVVSAFLRGLRRSGSYRHPQLAVLLERLVEIAGISNNLRLRVRVDNQLTPEALDQFISAFRLAVPTAGRECRYTLRALVMLASSEESANDLAENWLTSAQEETPSGWNAGASLLRSGPQQVAAELSQLIACTGATLFAVDQIDPVFAQARTSAVDDGTGRTANEPVALAADLGDGLMQMREVLSRTVTVVACLPSSWQLIEQNAASSVNGRFRKENQLARIPSAEIATELVTARFEPFFEVADFKPPYPTWPVAPEAFRDARDFTPRGLLQRVDEHVRASLEADEVVVPGAVAHQRAGRAGAAPATAQFRQPRPRHHQAPRRAAA